MNPVALVRAMRPHQWVKNVFVLAALVFALGEAGPDAPSTAERLVRVLMATAAFCLGASAIYLVNDVVDVESDRQHPKKCKRPIAAGDLSIPAALAASVGCVGASLALAHHATPSGRRRGAGSVMLVVGVYMTSNLLYSIKLKQLAIVDAFLIALGFMLRVVAGAYAAAAPISQWLLLLSTLFLALFLAFCKRRAEMDLLGADASQHRKNLGQYTPEFLDQVTSVLRLRDHHLRDVHGGRGHRGQVRRGQHLVDGPLVVFGLFRYLLLVQRQEGGGSPTRVLLGGDVIFVINALLWGAMVLGCLFL